MNYRYSGQHRAGFFMPTESPFLAYSVEKLEKNGELFFCRKQKHSELLIALSI
jgi:hypothetical protein